MNQNSFQVLVLKGHEPQVIRVAALGKSASKYSYSCVIGKRESNPPYITIFVVVCNGIDPLAEDTDPLVGIYEIDFERTGG